MPMHTVILPAVETTPGRRAGVYRDDAGRLWVVTRDGGVPKYPTLTFVRDDGERFTVSPNLSDTLHCWRCKSSACPHLRAAEALGLVEVVETKAKKRKAATS